MRSASTSVDQGAARVQTLLAGSALVIVAVFAIAIASWLHSKAREAGSRAADVSLRALQESRVPSAGQRAARDDREDDEAALLKAQRRHAAAAHRLQRMAIVALTVGLLGILGGGIDVLR